jgi:hypothetical protein
MGLILAKVAADPAIMRSYPDNDAEPITGAIMTTGKDAASGDMASFSRDEVTHLLRKVDTLVPSDQESFISKIVGENFASIITLARLVKKQAGGVFAGELASGIDQDIWLLEPKDIGGLLMNPALVAVSAIYGTAIPPAVFTWYYAAFAANTAINIIPPQAMSQYCGVVHLGMIDWVEVPKLNAYQYTMSGQAGPRQSLSWFREKMGSKAVSVARFELPIIVGPLKASGLAVLPNIAGASKVQLISFLIARAQDRMVL